MPPADAGPKLVSAASSSLPRKFREHSKTKPAPELSASGAGENSTKRIVHLSRRAVAAVALGLGDDEYHRTARGRELAASRRAHRVGIRVVLKFYALPAHVNDSERAHGDGTIPPRGAGTYRCNVGGVKKIPADSKLLSEPGVLED